MDSALHQADEKRLVSAAVEASIRIAVIGVMVVWCVRIAWPFVMPILWGIIIAVAVYPMYQKIEKVFKGRKGWAATVMTILMLLVLLVPSLILAGTLIQGISGIGGMMREGTLVIPPPPEEVGTWPIIGKQLFSFWTAASTNLDKLVEQLGPELVDVGKWFLSAAGSVGIAILLFVVSVIIAGVLLGYSESGSRAAQKFAARLVGEHGREYVKVAENTVRSVATGILGIAFIQAALAGLGMLVAGIPGAGFWAFLCLILAIVQIGSLPVLLPAAIYMFATADTLPAVLFAVWAVLVGLSDNILKPLLLGRGGDAPMLIVLIGAIGGMVTAGIVGLFVGAVIFSLGYRLFQVWLEGSA